MITFSDLMVLHPLGKVLKKKEYCGSRVGYMFSLGYLVLFLAVCICLGVVVWDWIGRIWTGLVT